MTQTHAETESQQDEPTTPVWFGSTQELPTQHPAFGGAPSGQHPAYPPVFQPPAGPPPSFPTRDGAEPAQPANRRRWTELTAVAAPTPAR